MPDPQYNLFPQDYPIIVTPILPYKSSLQQVSLYVPLKPINSPCWCSTLFRESSSTFSETSLSVELNTVVSNSGISIGNSKVLSVASSTYLPPIKKSDRAHLNLICCSKARHRDSGLPVHLPVLRDSRTVKTRFA